MVEVVLTSRTGTTIRFMGEVGLSLMEAIRDAGINELEAACGGCCSCATCHVFINASPGTLPPVSEDENELLSGSDHRQPTSRLSCQVILDEAMAGMKVSIAPRE